MYMFPPIIEYTDAGVRDSAKSMIITLMMLHGEKVLKQCDHLSERQLNDFQAKLSMLQIEHNENRLIDPLLNEYK